MSQFTFRASPNTSHSNSFDFSFGQPPATSVTRRDGTYLNDAHLNGADLNDGHLNDGHLNDANHNGIHRNDNHQNEDHKHHLSLLGNSEVSSADQNGCNSRLEEIRNAPLFTLNVKKAIQTQQVNVGQRNIPSKDVYPQYGMIGHREPPAATLPGDRSFRADRDILYANMNAPWSAFICGSQGAGKSHTFSCLLENALLSSNTAGILPDPLTGVVFHYDKFTSISSTQLCEAAYLCSASVPVQVLVSPSNLHAMQNIYHNLPGLPANAPKPQVRALKLHENHLNVGNMKTLMNVDASANSMPLYIAVLDMILRDMAKERAGRPGFSYADFKVRLRGAGFTKEQLGPLGLRLQLVEEFLDQSRATSSYENIFNHGKGSLTIIDLSCPFVDENAACALFSICLSLFLEQRNAGGRIIGLDEAHKFLTQSGEAANFTEQLISIIRQQRHLASRVIVSTQEPTLSPKLLELCNVAFVHRFRSPRWLDALKAHIAGAAKLHKTGEGSLDELFKTIVGLRTGEALVFSPDSILDVVNASIGIWDIDLALEPLLDRFVKVQIRNRISTDGGKSIMASDKTETTTPVFASRPGYRIVDLTRDASAEEEDPIAQTGRVQSLRHGKQESSSMTRTYSPQAQTKRRTSSAAPFVHRPNASVPKLPKKAKQQVSAADIEKQFARTTEAMLKVSPTVLDFGRVRCQVEDELDIIRGQLSSIAWKGTSKEIIKKTAVAWCKKNRLERPGFTKGW